MPETTTRKDRREQGRKRPVAAFLLATLAVGGIGAAVTSAAWTDNVFFAAPAAAATFDLQGSLDGTTWAQSDDQRSIALTVPAAQLANLLPGEKRDITLHVRNDGSVAAALTGSVEFSASTFTTKPVVSVNGLAPSLAPAGTDAFTLTVQAPADWDPSNQGKTGQIVVTVSGEATR